ncbi:MAG: hypothetical protein H0V83_14995 [Rubrobacter sp.]|nr:hypothetical protein [Rubrobacter sp.]
MEILTNIGIGFLAVVPMVLLYYIPSLPGMVILSERSGGYRIKAGLWFVIGFGLIVATQLLMTNPSALQAAQTLGMSAVFIAVALALASFTVYQLAD